MHVLATNELDGMHIDCICVPTRGHDLPVVVFVHVRIETRMVQQPMEGCVEGIVYDEK